MNTIQNLKPSTAIDKGIDGIVHQNDPSFDLPEHASLTPSLATAQPQLERLLARPNIDDYLSNSLIPTVKDLSLFQTQRFQSLSESASAALLAAAEKKPSASHSIANARTLMAGIERALLNGYLSMLIPA